MPPEGTARLRDEQKLLITELAQQDDPELEVKDIWKQVVAKFPRPKYHPPALGTVRNYVGEARKSKVDQDEPWSIGVSVQSGIPIEAMKVVSGVWEHVLLTHGRRITIRQAKWIARLRDLITEKEGTDSPEKRLYNWASLYAGREKATSTLGMKFDTSDMDASLLIKGGVYRAVVDTGLAVRFTEASMLNALAHSDPNLALEKLASSRQIDVYLDLSPEERRHQGRVESEFFLDHENIYRDAIPDEGSVTEDELRRIIDQVAIAMKVSRVWRLAILRDGKRWFELTEQRRMEILLEIARNSVQHHTYDHWTNLIPFEVYLENINFRLSDDIMKEVGYEPPGESDT